MHFGRKALVRVRACTISRFSGFKNLRAERFLATTTPAANYVNCVGAVRCGGAATARCGGCTVHGAARAGDLVRLRRAQNCWHYGDLF